MSGELYKEPHVHRDGAVFANLTTGEAWVHCAGCREAFRRVGTRDYDWDRFCALWPRLGLLLAIGRLEDKIVDVALEYVATAPEHLRRDCMSDVGDMLADIGATFWNRTVPR